MPERRRLTRNPVANSPLLRKGGVHQRTRSGQRQLDKQVLNDALQEWQGEIEEKDHGTQ